MAELPRLNGIIRALEKGHAFTAFSPADAASAIAFSTSKFDGIVFETEHNPWDRLAVRDAWTAFLKTLFPDSPDAGFAMFMTSQRQSEFRKLQSIERNRGCLTAE